jgi:thioredoxin-like negative regulator of GroEL
MKAVALYRPKSEHSRTVEEYIRDFDHQRGKTLELVSLDSVEGSDMARLYGIVEYPAILVIRDDGQLLKHWEGSRMPLMDEVAGFMEA